jgi:hypothetical protein
MNQFKSYIRAICITMPAVAALLSGSARADDGDAGKGLFDEQWYVSPLASYTIPDDSKLKPGFGGSFAAGYREGFYAIEAAAVAGTTPVKGGGQDVGVIGGSLNALLFPFTSLPGLYGTVGIGAIELKKYPSDDRQVRFSLTTFDGGLGYLQPLHLGRYRFAIRGEAVYRYGKRESAAPTNVGRDDYDAPKAFNDVVIQLGFYLPIGIKPPPPSTPDEPAQVVPLADSPVEAPVMDCAAGLATDASGACAAALPPADAPVPGANP